MGTTPDPAQHEAHETPLADRIIGQAIKTWLDRKTELALATAGDPPLGDYGRGIRAGMDQLRHLHLDDYWYTVAPDIAAQLCRAGLLTSCRT